MSNLPEENSERPADRPEGGEATGGDAGGEPAAGSPDGIDTGNGSADGGNGTAAHPSRRRSPETAAPPAEQPEREERGNGSPPEISVVVPLLDESESLPELTERVREALDIEI